MVRFAFDAVNSGRTNKIKRPVEDTVIAREYYSELIGIVEDTAKETDEDLGTYGELNKTYCDDDSVGVVPIIFLH